MSTIRLPCHKGLGRPDGNSVSGGSTNRVNSDNIKPIRLRPGQIPYVSHDNGKTRYYADRYYMDAPAGLLEHRLQEKSQKKHELANRRVEYCDYCGEKCQQASSSAAVENENEPAGLPARPLFDRAAFINSLELSAAIIATYTVGELKFLSETFPALFPPVDAKSEEIVPTLVLHGHRGWKLPSQRQFGNQEVGAPVPGEVGQNGMARDFESVDATTDEVEVPNFPQPDLSSCREDANSQSPPKYGTESGSSLSNKSIDKEFSERARKHEAGSELKSQSPAKKDVGPLHSTIQNVVSCEHTVGNRSPLLTYENETLNIKSTPRKRKRKKCRQADEAGQNPRRSPRLSPQGKNNLNAKYAERSPRRSQTPSPLRKEATRMGSTPIDAIVLDSDSESDICNGSTRVEIAHANDNPATKIKSASLEISKIETKKEISSCLIETPPISPRNDTAQNLNTLIPPVHSHVRQPMLDEPFESQPQASKLSIDSNTMISRKRLKMMPTAPSAAAILARTFGALPNANLMKPLYNPCHASDTSDDESDCIDRDVVENRCIDDNLIKQHRINHDGKAESVSQDLPATASAFGGQVYFTQVLPRWIPPKDKKSLKRKGNAGNSDSPELEIVRGCHHPKFFLLFEKRGSLVVIISTANLTQQNALDASWVQRFESQSNLKSENVEVDYGMTHDFGYVLTDLLRKQSEAAECQGMLPDNFLRMHVPGLSLGGLGDLARRYKFEDSHVHLVSTVPGDYSSNLPKKGVASCFNRPPYRHPTITYGPQRVSYILSRVLDKTHISAACATIPRGLDQVEGGGGTAAVNPWLPKSIVTKNERLVIQPTSMSGTWTREELEILARSYLEPHWKFDCELDYNSPIDLIDIVWPSMDYFNLMHEKRRGLKENHQIASAMSASKKFKKSARGPCHVFLSSVNFSKLDRVCISRMALYEPSIQPHMASYSTASLHFKSYCRMLRLTEETTPKQKRIINPKSPARQVGNCHENNRKEYISWFMLSSACLSKGAQGQPTPYRPLESDSMSYANFELGVLFCSRLLGDRLNDRLYVFDGDFSAGCQCGTGKRWYKDLLRQNDNIDESNKNNFSKAKLPAFLDSVRKVHLPIPYRLRPKPYQEDPESDFMSFTPYLHDIPNGTGAVGNMKLTPYGQQIARENSRFSDNTETSA